MLSCAFFHPPATTEFSPLSLHDALPIFWWDLPAIDAFDLLRAIYEIPEKTYRQRLADLGELLDVTRLLNTQDRKSTRLNSSHLVISYAVFCLKKKNKKNLNTKNYKYNTQ